MAENLSPRVTGKPLLPTDWYPMNKKRRYAASTTTTNPIPIPISAQQQQPIYYTHHHPLAHEFTPNNNNNILSTTPPGGSLSSSFQDDHDKEDATEESSLKNNVDEFIYIIGDAGQRMLIAGMTSHKHSAEDIAVAFQNYWFSSDVMVVVDVNDVNDVNDVDVDGVGGGTTSWGKIANAAPLTCDESVVTKAFQSIENATKNTWFFGKFSKGGGKGYEEALALLEVGICCAYGEVDAAAVGVRGGRGTTEEDAVMGPGEDGVVKEEAADDAAAVESCPNS